MNQVLLWASQTRPIAHTYSCCGVSCMEAQPVHASKMIGSRAAIRREGDPFGASARERGAMATSFDGSNLIGGVSQTCPYLVGSSRALLRHACGGNLGRTEGVTMR